MGELRSTFVEAGARSAEDVAADVVAFLDEATRSLDVAIYDFEAREGPTVRIADALEAALARGVAVRVVFNLEPSDNPADPRPMQGSPAAIDGLEVPTRGIDGRAGLMHHKYIVRDAQTVWTGSMNWTPDSLGVQENVLVTIDSPEVASAFLANFERLWTRGRIDRSGSVGDVLELDHGVRVRPMFSPFPPFLGHAVAGRIVEANRRIRVLSPVLTSGAVLGTLCEHIARSRLDVGGAYDLTQMEDVQRQWELVPHNRWKIEAWKTIAPYLAGKVSTRYRPDAVHDYMHAKAVVVDDEVITGSFNFSKHGEGNAENVLFVVSEYHAVRFAEFADRVAARYVVAST
jgi:phosphatidylserine/phosphatidylglycerophosphate/cardiolipin synthase-like enzyme